MGLNPYEGQNKSFSLGVQLWSIGVGYRDIEVWLSDPSIVKESAEYDISEIRKGWKAIDQDFEDYHLNSICEDSASGEFISISLEDL